MKEADLQNLFIEWKKSDQALRFGQYVYNLTGVEVGLSYESRNPEACYQDLLKHISAEDFIPPRVPVWV